MMTAAPNPPRRRTRLAIAALIVLLPSALGCSGLLQNLGAKWVTRQIAAEFDMDEAQSAATRASVDRLMAAAPAALSSKVDMLVATVDSGISRGLTEQSLIGMERQVDKIADIIAGAIIDEAAPILATLRDGQIDFAEARINERLDEARERIEKPPEERLEKRQDAFVEAVEDWADDITDAQEASLRQFIATLPDEGALRLRADEQRLERIGTLMRKHPGAQAIRAALWKEWKDREQWGLEVRTPAERRAEGRKAILYVYGMLDAEQKDHASEHLHELHDKVKGFLGASGS